MNKITALLFFALAFTFNAGAEPSGKTADGCTYRIINGKYLTDCSKKEKAEDKLIAQSSAPAPTAPVLSYDSVPVKESDSAPKSNFGNSSNSASTLSIPVSSPVQSALVVDREERDSKPIAASVSRQEKIRAYSFQDRTYLGFGLGPNTIRQSNGGSTMALGISVGTNIDDILGAELAYSYSKQGLYLGLGENTSTVKSNDTSLSAHLFSAEVQAHLTETQARLRPFLGAGLGLKFSTLTDTGNNSTYSTYSASGGSLSQQSIGASLSAGAKFNVSRKIDLIGSFRYFAPLLRQNAKLEAPKPAYGNDASLRLTQEDSALTGSSQYQILGGFLYAF